MLALRQTNYVALGLNDSARQIGTISSVMQAISEIQEIAFAILCIDFIKIF